MKKSTRKTVVNNKNPKADLSLNAFWITGFVDGEGCFTAYKNKQNNWRFEYQIIPAFIVAQHKRDINILYALKNFFKCGYIEKNKGKNDKSSNVMQWRVRRNKDLCNIIIPFFEKYNLQTKKKLTFRLLKKFVFFKKEKSIRL
jgi:hypothetical protein